MRLPVSISIYFIHVFQEVSAQDDELASLPFMGDRAGRRSSAVSYGRMSTHETAGSDFSFGVGVNLSQEGISEMGDNNNNNNSYHEDEVDQSSSMQGVSSWVQDEAGSSGPRVQSNKDLQHIKSETPAFIPHDVKTSSKPGRKVSYIIMSKCNSCLNATHVLCYFFSTGWATRVPFSCLCLRFRLP